MKRKFTKRVHIASLASIIGLLGACAAGPYPETVPPQLPGPAGPTQPTIVSIPPFESSGLAAFDAWRSDFAERALKDGRNPAVVYDVLRDLEPLEIYLPEETVGTASIRNRSEIAEQAEFAKPVWEYLRTAVSANRQTTGRQKAVTSVALFDAIEARYGVDGAVVAAIWGMETSFGSYIGDFDGPETLANMAVEGRRRRLAERELLAVMKIIEQGYANREDLVAGWAGAMGQTQFMPSTYLAHAVDFSGDGKRDVWSSEGDALASAANYLNALGYVADEPWGTEVMVPDGFDFSLANGEKRTVAAWQDLGLSAQGNTAFPANSAVEGRLWLPAGARGPKYVLFDNFDVFLSYNRSNSYALAVGLLADAIDGRSGPHTPWPTDIQPLSVADVKVLQAGLNQLGYEAGAVDGIAGSGTRAALQLFQKSRGLLADGYPTQEALAYVLSASQPAVSSLAASPG